MSERIFQTAVERYGVAAQTVLLAEECGELVAAASRVLRGRTDASAMAQEIADVRIMLDQMEHAYGLAAEVSDWRAKKLARLAERLDLVLDAEPKPRRTLADVVANPPEGWTSSTSLASGHEETHFDRRAPGGEVAVISISPGWASVEVSFGTSNISRARALSREVDDLLDVLAEVSDV